MKACGGAILGAGEHCDFEFTRQKGKFRM